MGCTLVTTSRHVQTKHYESSTSLRNKQNQRLCLHYIKEEALLERDHEYVNKFKIAVTDLFLIIICNN